MKKLLFGVSSSLFVFWLFSFIAGGAVLKWDNSAQAAATTTSTVTLSGTVTTYINLAWAGSGNSITFTTITPGSESCIGTNILSVTTNAANGYTVALHDGLSVYSSMLHTDTATRIPDIISGSLTTPIYWITGTTTGLGVNMFAADTTKEAGWGTGTTACDGAFDKWAPLPLFSATAHTAAGFKAGADTSSWDWKVNVENTQKTGVYSGIVTFTVTAVFS